MGDLPFKYNRVTKIKSDTTNDTRFYPKNEYYI